KISVALTSLAPSTIFAAGLLHSLGADVVVSTNASRTKDVDEYLIDTYLHNIPVVNLEKSKTTKDIELTNHKIEPIDSCATVIVKLIDPNDIELNEFARCCLGGATTYTYRDDGTPIYGFGDRYGYLGALYGLIA